MIRAFGCGNTQGLMVEFAVPAAQIESDAVELELVEIALIGRSANVSDAPPLLHASTDSSGARPLLCEGRETWMRRLVDEHFSFIWRNLRRLGFAEGDVDDAAQQVFIVAERRRADIVPGKERAFLYGVALRLAQTRRRSAARSREESREQLPEIFDPAANPEDLVVRRQLRALLDEVLERMPFELRSVFVLCELDEHTLQQAAELLQIPAGTVTSRLARARRHFSEAVQRITKQRSFRGAP